MTLAVTRQEARRTAFILAAAQAIIGSAPPICISVGALVGYQLLDADKNVLTIKGVDNLHDGLAAQLGKNEAARYFVFEEAALYTSRESQMIQAYLQQYGKMPGGGGDELDDLF